MYFLQTAVLFKFPKDNEGYYNFEGTEYFTLFCMFDEVFLDLKFFLVCLRLVKIHFKNQEAVGCAPGGRN